MKLECRRNPSDPFAYCVHRDCVDLYIALRLYLSSCRCETENERRRAVGIEELTNRENTFALQLYEAQIVDNGSEEGSHDFVASRIHHYEENRRQMYGHARHEHSPLIERLRDTRADVIQLLMDTYECSDSFDDAAREGLRTISSLLRIHIAMEREPSEEHWRAVRLAVTDAEQLIQASAAQARENINWGEIRERMAQNDQPAPASVHDSKSDSEVESPTRPRRDFFAPYSPGNEDEDEDDPWWSLSTF